jgi:two-component system, response regulator PdtaR
METRGGVMTTRVVIADDESIIRLDLKEILESAGYDVVGEAARGDDAAEMIRDLLPDLALLDVKMPGLDGIEVARLVQSLPTTVVLLTAFSQRELIESARDAGVSAYLVKPFRSAELLPKLASILNKPEPFNVESQESPVVDDKIETREIVQQAKEQLMAAKGLTESEAFELIQQSAMKSRRRMRDVAQEVIAGTYVE